MAQSIPTRLFIRRYKVSLRNPTPASEAFTVGIRDSGHLHPTLLLVGILPIALSDRMAYLACIRCEGDCLCS